MARQAKNERALTNGKMSERSHLAKSNVNSVNIRPDHSDTKVNSVNPSRSVSFPTTDGETNVEQQIRAALKGDAMAARRVLREIVDDELAARADRIKAAAHLLGLAGIVAPRSAQPKPPPAQLADMSTEQLRAILDQAEHELGARAKPVDAQGSAQDDGQLSDML